MRLAFYLLATSFLVLGCGNSGSPHKTIELFGNVNSQADIVERDSIPKTATITMPEANSTSFSQLSNTADFSSVLETADENGAFHPVSLFFFHTAPREYLVRLYVEAIDIEHTEDITADTILQLVETDETGDVELIYDDTGTAVSSPMLSVPIHWKNSQPSELAFHFQFTLTASNGQLAAISGN